MYTCVYAHICTEAGQGDKLASYMGHIKLHVSWTFIKLAHHTLIGSCKPNLAWEFHATTSDVWISKEMKKFCLEVLNFLWQFKIINPSSVQVMMIVIVPKYLVFFNYSWYLPIVLMLYLCYRFSIKCYIFGVPYLQKALVVLLGFFLNLTLLSCQVVIF